MRSQAIERLKPKSTCAPAAHDQVIALSAFFDRARKPRGISDINAKSPDTGEDWPIFNKVYPYIERVNKKLAKQLLAAMQDAKITKRFYDPDKVCESYQAFVTKDPKPMRKNPNYERALLDIKRLLGHEVIQPLVLEEDMDPRSVFSNMQASAGSIIPGKNKEQAWDIIYAVACWYYDNLPSNDPYPALPFSRSQISNFINEAGDIDSSAIKHKQRLVWCINAGMVLVEALFARPIMDKVLPQIVQYAGGKAPEKIRYFMRRWNGWHWVCLDYSNYDATVPKWLIRDVFEIIKAKFDDKYHSILDWICYHFIHTKIYMPDGTIKQKAKGIPSGSYFTQIVGSLVNMVVVRTYLYRKFGNDVNKYATVEGQMSFMVMGDDNVVFTAVPINRKDLSQYLLNNFGLEVNERKCAHGDPFTDPEFLKRVWQKDGEWRNPLELFVNMCTPERYRDYDNKDFKPAHVIFGYFLTYRNAMKEFFTYKQLVEMMHESGGAEKLLNVPDRAMPGSLYVLKLTDPSLFKSLVRQVVRDEANLAIA